MQHSAVGSAGASPETQWAATRYGWSSRVAPDRACGGQDHCARGREIFISGRAGQDFAARKLPVPFVRSRGLVRWEESSARCMNVNRRCCWCSRWTPGMMLEFLHKLTIWVRPVDRVIPKLNGERPLAAIYPKRCHAFAFSARLFGHATRRGFCGGLLAGSCRPDFSIPRSDARGVLPIATAPQMLEERTYRDRGQKSQLVYSAPRLQCCANGQSTIVKLIAS